MYVFQRRPVRACKPLASVLCVCLAMSVCVPSHAELVEFRFKGDVNFTNPDIALPGVTIGTHVKGSFLVDTSCRPGGLGIEFSGDPDPVLVRASSIDVVFRRLDVTIGDHKFEFDLGVGQLFIEPAPPGSGATYVLSMNMTANLDQADFFNIFEPGVPRSGVIRASDLPATSIDAQYAAILSAFDELPLFSVGIGGGVAGFNEIGVTHQRVRVLKKTPEDLPCPSAIAGTS